MSSYEPSSHYDRVTAAWTLMLGEELHYGVFDRGPDDLGAATGRLTELMFEAARIEASHEVLDVGCGTGAPACRIAADAGARVTGITTSNEGVAAARARAKAAGLGELTRFEVRDGMDNGFDAESFDRAWVLESSHLMRDRGALVGECARVLRPGGRIALCDVILRREMDLAEVRRLREPLALLREVYGDARMEPLARYAELMGGAGLEVDVETDLTADSRPTFQHWRENCERHHDRLVELLGEEDLAQFIASCDVLENFWDDGTLGYGLIAGSKPV